MLSIENYNKINKNGLYKSEPFGMIYGDSPYWCKNWTFTVKECNGIIHMVDTYFNDRYIEVTDDNIINFEFQFEFNDVKEISSCEYDKYEENDKYRLAIGSGGWQYGVKYFVKKNAEYSKNNLIDILKYEINSLKHDIKYSERELSRKENELKELMGD